MTANQKAQARIFFENRILKADNQAFEDLFTEIMRYKESDFRSIKPWGKIGDRKNDGYIPSRGIFYQVYAPEDIRKSYPDVVKKIKTDFSGLIEQWSDVKEFYFVVNDKYKGVNADSEQLLTQIKEDNGLDESKFITASDLENILFSLSDDQIIKITGVSFIDNPILTPAILQNSYLKKFSTISLLTTNTPKPIDEIFVNLAIIKEKKEEVNKDKTINREALLSSYEEIHKPKEPIGIKELINISNKSLIYGKAGIGKTTLCKYIAYKWAKGKLYQEFEYLIYIPLREWKSDSGIKGAIRDYYYSLDEKDISIDFDANKTLFLFDGYDELDGDKKKALRDEIDKYALTHYLITTRPYGYQKSDFRVDEYFETIGFTDEDVTDYIDNFFGKGSEKGKGLKNFLQSNISIKHIAYIPLMLEMIRSLWEQKEFGSDMTMTELYGQVIESMLKKHSANKDDARVYKRQNRKKIQEQLGKVAFEGLTQQTILFDGDFIEDSIDDIEFFEENSIYSGFLKSDAKEKDLLDNCFEFLHLTFQEYFSALYVAKLEPQEQSEIIRDWKFYPHMQMFFAFLIGLIDDKEFLLREIESEPRDLGKVYSGLMIIDFLTKIKQKDFQKSFINDLNNILIQWLIFIIEQKLDIKETIYKLYDIKNYINEKLFNKIIFYINNKKIDLKVRSDLIYILSYLYSNQDRSKVLNCFKNFLEEKNLDILTQMDITLKELSLVTGKKLIYTKTSIPFKLDSSGIMDFSASTKEIIEVLKFSNMKDSHIVDKLIFILRNKNLDEFKQGNIAEILVSIHPKTKELIECIKNETIHIYIKVEAFEALVYLNKVDEEIIKKIILETKKDKNIFENSDKLIAKPLRYLAKNKRFINLLISIIKDKEISFYVKKNIAMEFIDDVDFIKKTEMNTLIPFILIEKTLTSTLFKLFNTNSINLYLIFKNIFHNRLPLYIKNNKLHTIENGKEISTQREVDEVTFNEIKLLLKERKAEAL